MLDQLAGLARPGWEPKFAGPADWLGEGRLGLNICFTGWPAWRGQPRNQNLLDQLTGLEQPGFGATLLAGNQNLLHQPAGSEQPGWGPKFAGPAGWLGAARLEPKLAGPADSLGAGGPGPKICWTSWPACRSQAPGREPKFAGPADWLETARLGPNICCDSWLAWRSWVGNQTNFAGKFAGLAGSSQAEAKISWSCLAWCCQAGNQNLLDRPTALEQPGWGLKFAGPAPLAGFSQPGWEPKLTGPADWLGAARLGWGPKCAAQAGSQAGN